MQEAIIRDERDRVDVINMICSLNLSRSYRVEIKQHRNRRSTNQNNLFQKWMRILGDATGYSRREMEDFFEGEFLEKEIVTIAGVNHVANGRFMDLDTKDFSEAMERISMWVAENLPDVRLPRPDDGLIEARMRDA